MEREQGSLHDRLRDFGREPNPEILASLQSQLAERRGKKRPAWWLLAAAIVFVSGVSTTVFHALELEQNPHQTIAESTGKDVPLAGRTDASSVSKTTNSHAKDQTENNHLNQSQDRADSNIQNDPAEKELSESQPVNKSSTKRKNQHSEQSGQLAAIVTTKDIETQDGSSRESEGVEAKEKSGQTSAKQSKIANRKTMIGKVSLHNKGGIAFRNSRNRKTPNAQRESKTSGSVDGQISSTSRKRVLEEEPNQSISANLVLDQNLKSSDNALVQQEATVVSPTQEATSPKTETPANDLDSPKKDSIAKANPKDTVLVAAATDSTKVPAGKRLTFSVLAGTRYSAVRYYAINQEKSEFRNQLTNENGAFPSRMSFEAGTRIDYKLGNQFTVFGDLDFGYAKEDLYLLATSAVTGQFDRTVSGNSLILNPKQKTQKEHIAASIWYSSVIGGFGIQMLPQLPVIRVGAGMQFVLMSDVTRQLDGSTISNNKMSGPEGVGFLRASASKEIPFGTKGMLVVEPMVQYFLNPVYRMKTGTSILPLQTGVQVGWKW
jgi:hypothetical protein